MTNEIRHDKFDFTFFHKAELLTSILHTIESFMRVNARVNSKIDKEVLMSHVSHVLMASTLNLEKRLIQ